MVMEATSKRSKVVSRGLLSNHRYLGKKVMLLNALENSRARKKQQQRRRVSDRKLKNSDGQDTNLDNKVGSLHNVGTPSTDIWEVDSGFCSEVSPPASGRSSPSPSQTTVVALDCEMVGTGPGGRCNEVARCSIVDYHGNVLYDKYIQPCQPVTNLRTRWSGIKRHHLKNATPFTEAREEIIHILEGKVVVGHSIYNDFEALDVLHPCHMVRDTCATRLLVQLAGVHKRRLVSLKLLSYKLLNRTIQADRKGHCSVEDARAALDLYKLVEGQWEHELSDDKAPEKSTVSSSNHFMQDEYWPDGISDGTP